MRPSNINRRDKLSKSDVLSIKRMLWTGKHSQADIARRFRVTQPHISRIANNDIHYDIPWPDGLTPGPAQPEPAFSYAEADVPNINPSFDEIEREIYNDENLAAEELRESEEIFESIAASVEDEMNNQLLAALFNVEAEAEKEKPLPSTAPAPARIPWRQVKQRSPAHPMVMLTDGMSEADAIVARRVLEQVFAKLPAHQWFNEDVIQIIRDRWNDLGITAESFLDNLT